MIAATAANHCTDAFADKAAARTLAPALDRSFALIAATCKVARRQHKSSLVNVDVAVLHSTAMSIRTT
jgi:hypothetical protein